MGKLHEIIAVEGDLAGTARKIVEEATTVFSKHPERFQEETVSTGFFDDAEAAKLNTVKTLAMTTTVADKLTYVAPVVGRYWDAYFSKEATNQTAKADVVVDGKVLIAAVPGTVLLGMETKLRELRDMYDAIPTLAPGVEWVKSKTKGKAVYEAEGEESRFSTRLNIRPIILVPATDKHPAQIEKIQEQQPVARITITRASGMMSPAEKSDILGRIDTLIRAVKEARQRANGAELVPANGFAAALFKHIHADLAA